MIFGPGVLLYFLTIWVCGSALGCLFTMTLLFLLAYGSVAVGLVWQHKRYLRKMVDFHLPEVPLESKSALDLPGDLLLLAGKNRGQLYFEPKTSWAGVPGAILCELALQNLVTIRGEQISPAGIGELGNPLLNAVLRAIRQPGVPKDVGFWLEKLALASASITRHILESMVRCGILQKEEHCIWQWFTSIQYLTTETQREEVLWQCLRDYSNDSRPAEVRTAVLFSLAHRCSLTGIILHEKDDKATRIKTDRLIAELCPEVSTIIKKLEHIIARYEN